ncbi:MAG: hypothetical protein RRB22_01600 [Gammaproteobacteria bacterium]|nr:hypothetical protein [Gammaproteobacteria bacterium]
MTISSGAAFSMVLVGQSLVVIIACVRRVVAHSRHYIPDTGKWGGTGGDGQSARVYVVSRREIAPGGLLKDAAQIIQVYWGWTIYKSGYCSDHCETDIN